MVVGSDEEEKMAGLADSELLADSLIMYVNIRSCFNSALQREYVVNRLFNKSH